MTTLASFLPVLPTDLVHLVFAYAPGVALDVLPAHERIQVVCRLTGITLSDERASLILEQRAADNCDFDFLFLATDEMAWCEALWNAHSLRAFDELVRIGQIDLSSIKQRQKVDVFVMKVVEFGGDDGLELLRHLERTGSQVDILYRPSLFHDLAHRVTHPPTVQYLLHRLLDAHDPSFASRNLTISKGIAARFTRACFGDSPCPLDILAFQMFMTWSRHRFVSPLFDAIIAARPQIPALLTTINVLHLAWFYWDIDLTTLVNLPTQIA
jgi:hypothetical protein